jgi:hypothetical protein
MRKLGLVSLLMVVAHHGYADKPKEVDAIDVARRWFTAVHDRNVDVAAALVGVPLTHNLCVSGSKPRIATDTATESVHDRMKCIVPTSKPAWSVDKNVTFSIATAHEVAAMETAADPSAKTAPIGAMASDHQFVHLTVTWITARGERSSSQTDFYLVAVGPSKSGLEIDAVLRGLSRIAN